MRNHQYLLPILLLAISQLLLNACSFSFEVLSTPTSTPAVTDVITSAPQVIESTPDQTSVNDKAELFSSDQLGVCFSYPKGYTQNPYSDTVQIAAPILPGTDMFGLFWLEMSDSYDRTAEKIADEEVTLQGVPPENLGRWTMTLDGEQAVVLDGMSGQDPQRRVYVVHQQTLYVLAFMPTHTENKAAGDQMEALYTTITNSWAWSPCSVVDVITSAPQVLESPPAQTSVNDAAKLFSNYSGQLDLCFSYPQEYTQNPYSDTVDIAAPDLPGTDTKGRFWLEISESYGLTAEEIADQEVTYAYATGLDVDRWTEMLDGEQAVVLNGMSGQELQRRVYVMHQQTLYILAFWPARSENKAAATQMETLYASIMNSWKWSPCSAKE